MPTEIRRPSVPIAKAARTSDARSLSITPLATIGILAFVLHLAAGAVLDRSHASQIAPAEVVAAGDEILCTPETKPREPLLYD